MEPRLFQQQSQKLILSPQIRQYLRLLQLPLADLQQAIETELAENPLLEEKPIESEELDTNEKQHKEKDNRELTPGEDFQILERLGEDFPESFEGTDFSRRSAKDLTEVHNFQENLLTQPEVLSDFLLWQLRFADLDISENNIAQQIIGNIDENGYLRASLEEIATHCQCTPEAVSNVLKKIHALDPPGIGARNLQEALLLQLKKKLQTCEPARAAVVRLAIAIIEHHLPLLEKRDYHGLSKILLQDYEAIRLAGELIATLDPHPGRSFYAEKSLAVIPDAEIVLDDEIENQFKVEIHDEKMREIRINPYYRSMLRSKNLDEKSKIFLKEKLQNALDFLQAISLRKSTLREITEAIVKAQAEFLEKGYLHLKPLRLKDIAGELGIHESTVSRAIQGKYVSTPQGTIPYKSFFSTRLESAEGEGESQKSIMEKIRMLIEKESAQAPLSDDAVVKILANEGTKVARRTVAKYRDIMKILPSHLRRMR